MLPIAVQSIRLAGIGEWAATCYDIHRLESATMRTPAPPPPHSPSASKYTLIGSGGHPQVCGVRTLRTPALEPGHGACGHDLRLGLAWQTFCLEMLSYSFLTMQLLLHASCLAGRALSRVVDTALDCRHVTYISKN